MKRILLITLVLSLTALTDLLAESCLVVLMRDGSQHAYVLSQQPRLSFADGQLALASADAEASFPLSDIENFHFADVETSVPAINPDECRLAYIGGRLTITGLTGRLTIHDLTGRLVYEVTSTTAAPVGYELGQCPKGAYIVRYGRQVITLYNR